MKQKIIDNPAQLAVQAVGTQEKLASLLKISRQSVSAWVRRKRIPLARVTEVSKATGIPKKLLDPAFSE